MRVLIVGAAAVSGQAALKAARECGAEVIATTSRSEPLSGVDHTICGIDLAEENAVEKILADPQLKQKSVDFIVYIPARGTVGIDVTESKAEMIPPSLQYSVIPYLKLHKALLPRRTVALSGFMALPSLSKIYGAMTFTKVVMEQLAVRHPDQLQILRIGMFMSNSVRGIAILAQRRMMREKDFHPEWQKAWRQSGKKFSEFFYAMNYAEEECMYKKHSNGIPYRPTEPADIQRGFVRAFQGEPAPIINILGPWLWTEYTMPELPPEITERLHLIPQEIYTLF